LRPATATIGLYNEDIDISLVKLVEGKNENEKMGGNEGRLDIRKILDFVLYTWSKERIYRRI